MRRLLTHLQHLFWIGALAALISVPLAVRAPKVQAEVINQVWTTNGALVDPVSAGSDSPQTLIDAAGNVVISWGTNTGQSYVQKFDTNQVAVWSSGPVAVGQPNDYFLKMVEAGNDTIVIYAREVVNENYYDLYAQRLSSAGAPLWGTEVQLNSLHSAGIVAGQYGYLDAVTNSTGQVIVVWKDYRNYVADQTVDLFGQILDTDGTPVLSANGVLLHTGLAGAALGGKYGNVVLKKDVSDDQYILAWTDENGGSFDMKAIKFNNSFSITWNSGSPITIPSTSTIDYPFQVVIDSNNNIYIAWIDSAVTWQAQLQKIDATGNVLWVSSGKTIAIADNTSGDYFDSLEIKKSDTDNLILTTISINSVVQAQKINGSGDLLWNGTSGVEISNQYGPYNPTIISDSLGNTFVTWSDSRQGVGNSNVYIQRLNGSGALIYPHNGFPVTESPGNQNRPQIVADSSNNIYIVWNNDQTNKLYFQKMQRRFQIDIDNSLDTKNAAVSIKLGTDNGVRGVNLPILVTKVDDTPIADVNADITSSDISWVSVNGGSDIAQAKSFVSNLSGAAGVVSNHTLYVPKLANSDSVIICPDATDLASVTESCTNSQELTVASPDVSIQNISGQDYWVIANLTGTGGISKAPLTPTPSPSTHARSDAVTYTHARSIPYANPHSHSIAQSRGITQSRFLSS
jgi:hypothetical protein